MDLGESSKKKLSERKIRRFSKIETEKEVPFFKYYHPQADPVLKQEKRKMKATEYVVKKPKIKMKCISCKNKKTKVKEEKKREKYIAPVSKKWLKEAQERHKKSEETFFVCKKEIIRLPSPIDVTEVKEKVLKFESAHKDEKAKVIPKKLSMTESTLKWPPQPAPDELALKIPKSKIFINKTKKKEKKFPPVDSIDYIYDQRYRIRHPWYEMFRGSDQMSFYPDAPAPSTIVSEGEEEEEGEAEQVEEEITDTTEIEKYMQYLKDTGEGEGEEEVEGKGERRHTQDDFELDEKIKRKSRLTYSKEDVKADEAETETIAETIAESICEEMKEEEGGEEYEFPALEKISAATSIASDYKMKYPADDQYDTYSLVPSVVNKILQKYQRESEIELLKQEKIPYKRGTLKSHSTTKMPLIPGSNYFGTVVGTIHYGDKGFAEQYRYKQGLPMCVAAYIGSFITPPTKWQSIDIDRVLEIGNRLYAKSLEIKHLHDNPRILQPEELYEVIELIDKKIKYKIEEPDIAGFTRSEDPKVYNLVKGTTLFFKRNRAGIFQTYNTNILIFRQKHFFVFDPEPRTNELWSSDTGTSILASFYDIPAIMVMILDRGKIGNWPFIISKISVRKIATIVAKEDEISLSSEMREDSLYKIISAQQAIVHGAMHIGDPCFGDTKNKQSMAVALMALIYSHITPACAWHRKTVDKILMVANQFYIECLKDTELTELKLENIPAFFTIGPLMIEILIYANQFAGLMFRQHVCLFEELLTKFFCGNTSAIVEIDKYCLAMWKDRDVFYMFDPYGRDQDGIKIKDGGQACVMMSVNVKSLVKTVLKNFNIKDYIFKIHILKIVKIHRDPEFEKVPHKHIDSEENITGTIKLSNKRAMKTKNITIDHTEIAARTTMLEEKLDPSLVEIGSLVGSLDNKYVGKIPECPSKSVIPVPAIEEKKTVICDLDSPSLSDTQIERPRPSPLRTENYEFRVLDEILKEEMELIRAQQTGEDGDRDYLKLFESPAQSIIELEDVMVQKGKDFGIPEKTTRLLNTDVFGLFPPRRSTLELNKPPKPIKHRGKLQHTIEVKLSPLDIAREMNKPSNFINLPDGSQILYSTKNISDFGNEFEDAAPVACMVAITMAKKYTLSTWSQEVIDAILDYGFAVYKTLEIKFIEIPKIDVPQLTIGSLSFHVVVDYLFDSLLSQSILEESLEKLVFREKESALILTEPYCCAVFLKHGVYYMFDPYGNNLVGLSNGPENVGVAAMFRFSNLYALVSRFLYNKKQRELLESTEAARFIIRSVEVKVNFAPVPDKLPRRERQLEQPSEKPPPKFENNPKEVEKDKKKQNELTAKNIVGYHEENKFTILKGSEVLSARDEGPGKIKECHFICICAMIGIFGRPIKMWDTKRVNYVIRMGKTLFGYVDNMNFADKRDVSNLLFDKYFYEIIVKRLLIADKTIEKSFSQSLDRLLIKNKFLLIQFSNCCYLLYKDDKDVHHLFDPYGVLGSEDPKACWIKFRNRNLLRRYIYKVNKDNLNTFFFYTISVSHIKKASKRVRLEYKVHFTQMKKKKKPKQPPVFHESEDWLTEYPIPWSRMKKNLAAGLPRGTPSHRWFNWDVEYPGDVYSITSTKHQSDLIFSSKSRNKQTIANCLVAIIMTEMYDFTEWNSNIMDSILETGDKYFKETFKHNTKKNYEVKLEDFPLTVNVFPYTVNLDIIPLIEGTMFIIRPEQFNLAKALRYFFEPLENRCGIICCNNGRSKTKYVAFGRIREGEYFMFDCQTIGPPMFVDRFSSKAYVLRCVTLNRLLHILTMTVRGGDFFIYFVGIAEDQAEKEIKQEDLQKDGELDSFDVIEKKELGEGE